MPGPSWRAKAATGSSPTTCRREPASWAATATPSQLVTADGVETWPPQSQGGRRRDADRAHRRCAWRGTTNERRCPRSCGCRTATTCRCRPIRARTPPASISWPPCPTDAPLTLAPGARALVPTGIAIALPQGHEAQVRPRSGLAVQARPHRAQLRPAPSTPTTAARSRCCWSISAANRSTVTRGMRIAQLVVAPVARARLREVASLDETDAWDRRFRLYRWLRSAARFCG